MAFRTLAVALIIGVARGDLKSLLKGLAGGGKHSNVTKPPTTSTSHTVTLATHESKKVQPAQQKSMTSPPMTREELDKEVAALKKKSEKEVKLASQDGEGEQNFFRKEYASKIAKLQSEFKKQSESATKSTDGTPSDLLFMLADDSKGKDKDNAEIGEDWEKSLSEEDRETLEGLIANLQEKSEKEIKLASEDGSSEQNFFRKEYAKKIDHVREMYKHNAEHKEETESASPDQLVAQYYPTDTMLVAFMLSGLIAGASFPVLKSYGFIYFRLVRNWAQVALLEDTANE